jgi:predicted hotdog family 3-hydroxylacyl-ACP dehydratase
MAAGFPQPCELAPHAPPMLLVDRVLAADAARIRAAAVIALDNPFHVPGRGVPAYVGFELMAQTISIQDGLERRRDGQPPAIGFLLGCRRYLAARDWLQPGERLEIEAVALVEEGEMRSFDCRITAVDGQELASGVLTVFRPADPRAFFERASGG